MCEIVKKYLLIAKDFLRLYVQQNVSESNIEGMFTNTQPLS